MKTVTYNPSQIELEFAQALDAAKDEIQSRLKISKIISIEKILNEDNPKLIFKLEDTDGDKHELVVAFIQRLDE